MLNKELLSSEGWEKYSLTYSHDFVDAIKSILVEITGKQNDIKIILILDEAERLYESGDDAGMVLRATLSVNKDVVAIIAGTSKIKKIGRSTLVSPFSNIFIPMILQPLSREATEALIIESSRQINVSYESGALRRICELSGGIPFYTQVICSELIDMVNEEKKSRITLGDVNKIGSKISRGWSNAFQVTFGQLDDKEKAILSILTSGKSLKNLRELEIQELENKQLIVEENGRYRFVSELFKIWLKQIVSNQ